MQFFGSTPLNGPHERILVFEAFKGRRRGVPSHYEQVVVVVVLVLGAASLTLTTIHNFYTQRGGDLYFLSRSALSSLLSRRGGRRTRTRHYLGAGHGGRTVRFHDKVFCFASIHDPMPSFGTQDITKLIFVGVFPYVHDGKAYSRPSRRRWCFCFLTHDNEDDDCV